MSKRVQDDPSDNEARVLYGTMLIQAGRYEDARTELDTALRASPTHWEARRALIQVELATDHPEQAAILATEGLDREPALARALLWRARAYLILGRIDDAHTDLVRMLAVEPTNQDALELQERVNRGLEKRAKLAHVFDLTRRRPVADWLLGLAEIVPTGLELLSLLNAKPPRASNPGASGELLANVRGLNARGEREAALELLSWHLEAVPTDTDARTLYGTILSWAGRLDAAREQFARVLQAAPGHHDATAAWLRTELWADHPERAESLATAVLQHDKDNPDLLFDRARARFARGDLEGATADLDRLLMLDPNHIDARRLRARLQAAGRVWTLGGSYTLDAFSDGRTPWHEATFQAKRKTPFGALIMRGYEAWRFDLNDSQLELEAFPSIREGTYADVAIAFSPQTALYPHYRLQADLYQSLPHGFEVSAGYRHLQFDSGVDMGVVTLGKYLGDFYFTLRAFITPGVAGTSVSVSGSVRRYLLGNATYVGIRYGHGVSKEELRSANDIVLLASNTVGVEAAIVVADRWETGVRAAVSQEARAGRSDLRQYDVTTSLGFRF